MEGVGGTHQDGPTGFTYGSITTPTNSGSGGNGGGLGGGAVRLAVDGAVLVNGTISADGVESGDQRGGAGGSVYLTSGTLSGTGTIRADGASVFYGSGGGGRVSVVLTNSGAGPSPGPSGSSFSLPDWEAAGSFWPPIQRKGDTRRPSTP